MTTELFNLKIRVRSKNWNQVLTRKTVCTQDKQITSAMRGSCGVSLRRMDLRLTGGESGRHGVGGVEAGAAVRRQVVDELLVLEQRRAPRGRRAQRVLQSLCNTRSSERIDDHTKPTQPGFRSSARIESTQA